MTRWFTCPTCGAVRPFEDHPEVSLRVPSWIAATWTRHHGDPRRDAACDGCQLFGVCALHATPEEIRLRSGGKAIGPAPAKPRSRRRKRPSPKSTQIH